MQYYVVFSLPMVARNEFFFKIAYLSLKSAITRLWVIEFQQIIPFSQPQSEPDSMNRLILEFVSIKNKLGKNNDV